MAITNVFTSGITELLLLSILEKSDNYVYEITQSITKHSDGLLNISPNTLYTVAYKMEQEGYISEYTRKVGRKRTRIYYHLEPSGKVYLRAISEQYHQTQQGVASVLAFLENAVASQEERDADNET